MENETPERTVVVSATCFADASSAIELSAYLAAAINADLKAYLIEDATFYKSAALPFSRVIKIGNSPQNVSPKTMLAAFECDAVAYQQAVEDIAQKKSLNWTFEKRRGEFDVAAPGKNDGIELIVFGYQQLRKSRGEIILLIRVTDNNSALLGLAASLSKSLSVSLHVALFPELSGEAPSLPEISDAKIRKLADKISIVQAGPSLLEFIKSVQRASPTAIIAKNDLANEIGVNTIVNAGRCPLVLATSSKVGV